MLAKTALVESVSNNELRSIFIKAEAVRNLCAHGASVEEFCRLLPQADFSRFLHRTQELVENLILSAS
jgi:hypothetical protein